MQRKTEHIDCANCTSRESSLFCDLHGHELAELSDSKRCVFYKKGQLVFSAGAYPHGLYCVKAGKIKIFQTGDEGKEQIVRMAKSGDVLGYRSLLSGDTYSASAVVLDESSFCFIPKSYFLHLLETNGNLSMQLMKLLSEELKFAEHRITDIAQKPVRERVAEAILYLIQMYGYDSDGATLNVTLSREDIANIVGTATETTIRLLSELKNDQVIQLNGKRITVLNHKELLKAANIWD
jgi:CRP/FNR family transcriptional regulator